MERLTYDFSIGGNHCWQVKGDDNLECREVCQIQGDKGCKDCPIAAAFDRLAAYEDTGFTPEEVQQMRWIPVEERLPKPQENPVIACDYTGVCLAWYSPTMGWRYRTGLSGVDITHWMPLPQPPKEGAYEK